MWTEEPRDRSPLEPCVPGLRVSQQHSTGCGLSRFLAEEMGCVLDLPGPALSRPVPDFLLISRCETFPFSHSAMSVPWDASWPCR